MNREPGTRRGAFLAAGASQTGKTETFKALAKRLGVEILIVPCGNLKHGEDVSFLVGSTPGHIGSDAGGKLTNFLRDNPNGIVVFDEIEKADPEILDALLTPLAGKPVKFMS